MFKEQEIQNNYEANVLDGDLMKDRAIMINPEEAFTFFMELRRSELTELLEKVRGMKIDAIQAKEKFIIPDNGFPVETWDEKKDMWIPIFAKDCSNSSLVEIESLISNLIGHNE